MLLCAIVATSDNDVISKNGKIPWRLPADFANLKKVTMGYPLIMGRKTHDSIGITLPGRTNIVISRNPDYKTAEGSILVGSLDEALNHPQVKQADKAFIFGGEAIYSQALPMTKRLYLTKVHTKVEGDTHFSYSPAEWKTTSSENHKADDLNQFDWTWLVLDRKEA